MIVQTLLWRRALSLRSPRLRFPAPQGYRWRLSNPALASCISTLRSSSLHDRRCRILASGTTAHEERDGREGEYAEDAERDDGGHVERRRRAHRDRS